MTAATSDGRCEAGSGTASTSATKVAQISRFSDLLLFQKTNMATTNRTFFSHVKPTDTEWRKDGLRDFFLYKDLGIAAATSGQVIAQLVRAAKAPQKGTGWHVHEAQFHMVLMLKGWAKFMYEDKETLVAAGDCVHQRPGIAHFLFDYSPDMEYLEVVGPADFGSVEAASLCEVPDPAAWPQRENIPSPSQLGPVKS
jgi:quercetin dioxygenase-like cupin family protein